MKMRKTAVFVEKCLELNMLKIKARVKIEISKYR